MPSPLSAKQFIVPLVIGCLALINVQAYLLNTLNFPLRIVLTDSIISNILLLLCSLLVLNVIRYYLPASNQYLGIIGSCLVLSGMWLFVTNTILKIFLADNNLYANFLQNSLLVRYGVAFLVLTIVSITAILWYNRIEQHKQEQRKTDVEKLSREAELFKLRQQLQPHFLFNSLNSINALIGQNPQQARKMVQQLSDFLRGTLKKEETQLVALEEEISYLNLYLEIEKVRFGNRLQTAVSLDENSRKMMLPTLLLQPIVENAIKFGLYDTTGETLIQIEGRAAGNELFVTVSNPYDPETAAPQRGTGFGLASIKRRLYLLFARNDLLTTEKTDHTFTTSIKIPQ